MKAYQTKKQPSSAGFSLTELMTVVIIIAILTAVAVPQYMKYVKKSRTAEATSNLGTIAMFEETYYSENDSYVTCQPNPLKVPTGGSGTGREAFSATPTGWSLLGKAIPTDTPLYFQYEVRAGQYSSVSAVVTGGTGMLVAPTTATTLGGSTTPCADPGSGKFNAFQANGSASAPTSSLNIPANASSNWFYATAAGDQTPGTSRICSVFVKIIDRPDLFVQDDIQ
jgi:prepilin-type N-terminal cleavage/methylation domain-containing protein